MTNHRIILLIIIIYYLFAKIIMNSERISVRNNLLVYEGTY